MAPRPTRKDFEDGALHHELLHTDLARRNVGTRQFALTCKKVPRNA
jgi:hypothetical protein